MTTETPAGATSLRTMRTYRYHLDYETYSETDLKLLGAFRYAEDPLAEILIAAVSREALEDGKVVSVEGPFLWVNPKYVSAGVPSHPTALQFMEEMFSNPDAEIWAHNAQFESVITKYLWKGSQPNLRQWRCTAALARKAGLPADLFSLSRKLNLKQQKDACGHGQPGTSSRGLIGVFCVPQKPKKPTRKDPTPIYKRRILPQHDPVRWKMFCDYCLQDVRAEMEVLEKFSPIILRGFELASFQQDMIMNHRGIPVDVPALLQAKRLVEEITRTTTEEFVKETGLQPTQREKVLEYLWARGAKVTNMRANTLKAFVAEGDELVEEDIFELDPRTDAKTRYVVELYQRLSFAAIKKVKSMLALASPDGRIRGCLLWYGAGTGRSSGVKVQPQNFRKPTVDDTALAFSLIKAGCSVETLELIWGKPLEVIASCIRHFITGPLYDADYAAIEARGVCWMAGQDDVVEMFRNGAKLYEWMASIIFAVPETQIKNPSFERDTGKFTILGGGYGVGPDGLRRNADSKGLTMSDELAKKCVTSYRELCYKVKEFWYAMDSAAKNAIRSPGARYYAGKYICFQTATLAGLPYLIMTLPSGRKLFYPEPKVEMVFSKKLEKDVEQVTYFGKLTGKNAWGRLSAYGGLFTENANQAAMGDIMTYGTINAEAEGFTPFLPIHDQLLADNVTPDKTIKDFIAALTRLPEWAKDIPIKAEGKIQPYYTKG